MKAWTRGIGITVGWREMALAVAWGAVLGLVAGIMLG